MYAASPPSRFRTSGGRAAARSHRKLAAAMSLAVLLGWGTDGCGEGTATVWLAAEPQDDQPCPGFSREVCDGVDNDCDGRVDEGVHNPCGHCDASCFRSSLEAAEHGNMDQGATIIEADASDNPTGRRGVTLTTARETLPYLWAANHAHNTVSKFNTDTHEEEGIFWAGRDPSRTAVDLDGNCWVGGRDDGRLTKILAVTGQCPDRNNDGVVQTSGAGGQEPALVNSSADPLADECVAYSAVPNPNRPSIRGLAVGTDGTMWIGYTGGGIQSIDPSTFQLGTFHHGENVPLWVPSEQGTLVSSGDTVNAGGVYGMVIDGSGLLCLSTYSRDLLPCFDTLAQVWIGAFRRDAACSYGIAVDGAGRIWTGGFPRCAGVSMFDHTQLRFYTFAVPHGAVVSPGSRTPVQLIDRGAAGGKNGFLATGVAAEPATGNIWTSFYAGGYTGRLILDPTDYANSEWVFIGTALNADGSSLDGVDPDLRGVGFDRRGYGWTLGLGSDRVFKIDPATNARADTLPQGQPLGVGGHYTYSDFTGSTALNFTAPRGSWSSRQQLPFPCAIPVTLELDMFRPATTSAGLRVRMLDEQGLPVAGWVPQSRDSENEYFALELASDPVIVDLTDYADYLGAGQQLEIEVVLRTAAQATRPILHRLEIEWQLDTTHGACRAM